MSGVDTGVELVYLAAAACFVLGLHLMNSPATARRGNQLSAAGMIAAIVATLVLIIHAGTVKPVGWIVLIVGAAVGAVAGLFGARRVAMTAMPQLVSLFNAVGGGAAAIVAIYDFVTLASGDGTPIAGERFLIADRARRHHRRGHVRRFADRLRQAAGHDLVAARSCSPAYASSTCCSRS